MTVHDCGTWRGWPSAAGGEWVDLTYPISPGLPRLQKFAPPRLEKVSSLPEDPSSVTLIEMVCHTGTHLDAPNHFVVGAPGVDEIPLTQLYGTATVVHIEPAGEAEVRPEALELAAIGPEEIVILETGWWRTPGDGDHPYLGEEAARWLVERDVKLVAMDLPTPELPVCRRPADFDWPAHRILLGSGVLIAENLANLGSLPAKVEALVMPLPIVGADGAPARVLARPQQRS
jgi:arylformamidase